MNGRIAIDRQIMEWEWWGDINVFRLWMVILMLANWQDKKWQGQVIKRGSFITSYASLAEISGLSMQQTRTAINKLKSTGEKRLSAKTIKNTVGLLSAAYDHAIFIGQLKENPCKRLSLPKLTPKDIRIFYLDEIPSFLEAIADVDLNERCAYELALFLGLRRSEILGLKEADVDIVKGLVYVHNTRHRVDGVDIEQDTKTKKSTRILALPDILILDLARLIETHRQFKYESVDFLIQDGFGNALGSQALSSRLSRLEQKKGLPNVTLHGLRHTYASLLHSQGVDMANISAELGHSNLATTMNIYTHIFQSATNASRGIANTINDFMLPQKNGVKSVANEAIEKP